MKEAIVLVFMSLALIISSCIDDRMFQNCPNELYCPDHQVCCPVGYPVACGGLCYTNAASAWLDCGRFGWSVESCYAE